jgi:AmiR/NasT family two-component response regulator
MLMLLHDITEEQAFDLLRRHSQGLNIKLAGVARAVTEKRGQLPSNGENLFPPNT